ncbi:HEAT repeat domain-containing protein, partial [Bdellovibrionota bacterium FG-2]
LKELTKTFIKNVAAMKKPRLENVQDALQLWAYTSNLSTDVGRYLAPAPQNDTPTVARLMKANPPRAGPDGVKGSAVDVDAIDLGIEYTARFPLKMKASYADKILPNNKKAWLSTDYDLTLEERQALIKRLATNLGKQLNGGTEVPVTAIENGGHGHSLVIVYQVKDAKGRDWRIEWDGVGRDYDPEGVILESGRGGHCEVVTPKFNPDAAEMQAVFRAFKATNMIPATEMGGGHINIDLAPFAGKPREIARFLAIFLENRGVVATMFQRIDRLKNGEPTEISSKLIERLKNFAGTEAELKQLLYNERYFNTRVGRKSRYIQLDLSAYFQDVIPSEFISPDFDLKNEVWRQTFRVDPKVRKAELRLMNAPRDEVESALQIKLVRAMLDFAFNQDTSLTGQVQKVDFEGSVKNPERALKEFAKTMARFGLDPAEFRPYFLDGLSSARYSVNSPNYQPLNVALSDHPKVAEWGVATQERSLADSLNSEDNPWSEKTHPKAVEQHAIRKTSQIEAQKLREAAAAKGVVSNLSRKAAEKFFVDRILGDPAIFDALSADQKLLALGELHSREDAKDFVTNALEKLKTSSDFSSALTNVLKRPGDTSPEGARWLAGLIQPGEPFKVAQGAAIRHADAEVRNLGYKALGNLRGKGVLTILSSVFEKWGPSPAEPAAMGDALLRLSAVNLGKTKSFDPANLVTSIASQIPNLSAESLAYATVLFHNLQGPGVVVGVKAFLAHEDPAVRRMGVSALEGHYDGESLQLARELKNDMDPKIRALAKLTLLDQKKALSSISDSELQILETTDALDVLLRRKETKKGFKIRLALLEKRKDFPQAIDQFFKKHTADPRTEPELLVPFAQTLKTGFSAASYAIASKSSKVRAEGYRALMAESDANTLAASLLSAFSKIVPGDRNVAADYLAHSKDIDFLKKSTLRRDYILALKVLAFATSDGAVRKEALQQLVKIDSEGSLVVLGELAASEYPEVRRGAAKAIKSSTHFQATAEMKKLLTHDDPKTVLIAKEGLEARFRFFAKLPLGTIATLPTSDALIALQQRSKKTSKSTEVERILNQLKLREDFKAGAQSLFGPAFAEDPALQRFVLENVPPEMVAKMGYIAFLASSDPKIRDVGLKILINQKDLNSIAKGGGLTSRMMKEGPALDAVDAFTKIALTGEDEKIILHYLSQAIANAPRDQPWVMATLFPKIMMTAAKLSPAALADPYYGRVFTAEIITTLGASTPKKTLAAAAYFFKRGVQSTEVAGLENLARRVPELRPYVTSTLTAIATRNGTESCLTQALEAFAAGAP